MKNAKKRLPITERFGLPEELLPGAAKITLSGGSHLTAENHGGLISYATDCICIRRRGGMLRIAGEDLELAAMTKTDIIIRGIIVTVELC